MTKSGWKLWVVPVVLVLAGSLACETQTSSTAAPGQLPKGDHQAHVQPRVDSATYFAHGHLLERQGHLKRAVDQYARALQVMPDYVAARNRLGITLNKLGRHSEATEQFRIAADDAPNYPHIFNNLGFSLYLEEQYDEAVSAIEQALALRPEFARARMNYALTLGKLGRHEEAFAQFEKVGPPADAYYNLAILQTDAGDYLAAVESLDQALEHDPEFEAARAQLKVVARLAAEAEPQEPTYETGPVQASAQTPADGMAATQAVATTTDSDAVDDAASAGANAMAETFSAVRGFFASTSWELPSFDLWPIARATEARLNQLMFGAVGTSESFFERPGEEAAATTTPAAEEAISGVESPFRFDPATAVSLIVDQTLRGQDPTLNSEQAAAVEECGPTLPPEYEELLLAR